VKKRDLILGLIGLIFLAGCTPNRPYRLQGVTGDLYENKFPGQQPPFEEVDVALGRNYRLSFVEFDDKGDFWDRGQLAMASSRVKYAPKPVLLVIFIHGWHHNAADRKPGDKGDVETFRCLLSQLAVSESSRHLQVHGIYLGWRGRLVQGPLDYLTFLGRKAAATRVAGTPVTETIFELIRQARRRGPEASKTIVIGHSFGALVLEKAMAQAVAGSILAQDAQSGGRPFPAPADLVLLVNSASESIYAKELSDMFRGIGHRSHVNAKRPLFISITSETDTATKGWFPLGTFLPNLFARRHYDWGEKRGPTSDNVSQHEYLTTTPGHNRRLFTHHITSVSAVTDSADPSVRMEAGPPGDCATGNPGFEENIQRPRGMTFATARGASENLNWWEIKQIESVPPLKPTPYWVMHVPREIIHGHGPIFTAEGCAMMAALFRLTNPKTEPGPRTMTVSD